MRKLSTAEVNLLNQLVQSQTWDVLTDIVKEIEDDWQQESCISTTEFETLKKVIAKEVRIQTLKTFLEELQEKALS